ncbi:MAG: hypothetical protein ABIN61_06640 [candidate division WOR-3 bacterium]
MNEGETYEWTGGSGQRYLYNVYSLPISFKIGEFGNYIFARKNTSGDWIPIYIGEGDLGRLISEEHPFYKCIKEKGATHIHIHINASEWARISEENDLLESHLNAFEPYGCNPQRDSLL